MALLKTVAELKNFVALDCSQLPPGIAQALLDVEQELLAPLLGSALLAWLQAAYDAAPPISGPAADLLRQVQRPLAQLAVAAGLPAHQVSIDNTGVHIMSTETQKTAFAWQVNQLTQVLRRRGLLALDILVEWLEENREANPELQAWAASPAGQRHRQELFTRTADFQEFENISNSRAVFLALGPVRRRMEYFEVGRVLGQEFLLELREQVRTRAVSADNQNLLRTYVYPALASLTIGRGIPELGLSLAGDGVQLPEVRTGESNGREADAGLDALLASKASEALMSGARYLRHLTDYLDRTASATRFPTYFASAAYTAPNPAPATRSPNAKILKFY